MHTVEATWQAGNPLAVAARARAAEGWAVHPLYGIVDGHCECKEGANCKTPGKHPRLTGWQEKATKDPEQTREWWERWPHANIGGVAGSGRITLDIDPRNGGDISLELLEAEHSPLPETQEVLTGGGGRHLYFADPGRPIGNTAGVLGPGLDIRSDGGNVVLPGSRHVSGKVYEYEATHGPEAVPLAPLPPWLLTRLTTKGSARAHDSPKSETIHEGQRNDTLFHLGCLMRKKGMSHGAIEAALFAENTARCGPPLSESEVRKIAESAARYDAPGPLILTRLSDLLNEPEERVSWLVESLLITAGFSLLVAKPKVGKSTLARVLALAIATGGCFLGRKTLKGPVVYFALEEKRSEVKKHFRDMGATGEEDIYIFAASAPADALQQIRVVAEEKKPALIIIDPLFRLTRVKDGNDYAQVTAALEPLLVLARETGAHVLCVHHAGKGDREGGDSILGSTAIFAAVDTALMMKRSERYRTISSQQRYGEDLPEAVLHFDAATRTVSLGESKEAEEEKRIADAIVEFLRTKEEPVTEAEIDAEVEGRTTRKRKALRELVAARQVERIGKGGKKDPFRYVLAGFMFSCSQYTNGNTGTTTTKSGASPQQDSSYSCSQDSSVPDDPAKSREPEKPAWKTQRAEDLEPEDAEVIE